MKKIFIVGNSRSGTTMLGRVFDLHSKIHTFDELHFFEHQIDASTIITRPKWNHDALIALVERLITSEREYRHFFAKVTPGKYREDAKYIVTLAQDGDPISVYEAFLSFETGLNGKDIPCEQTPRYLFFVQEILDVFPDALIINLVRDPRDVLLSQKNKWKRRYIDSKRTPLIEALRSWVNYHPYTITRLWVSAVRMAERFEGSPRFISLRYEDLLEQPESSIRSLCLFTGIEFEPEMLLVSQIGSSTGKDKPESLGIDAKRSGAWAKGGLSETEMAICQQVAGKEMNKFNYSVEPVKVASWRKAVSMSGFAFKVLLALMLNLNRTTNIIDTLRRRLRA